ncbi:hypothetical protein [uncultured Algibacter sp.]|uniref:hypothetical protein n=1 Tax=uncultured Algibacter sp. TaxID=298659 RepID=UPI003217D17F
MESNIEILMSSYEELAEENLNLALEKMIHLYFSNDDLSHEISDSIELWVYEKGNIETLEIIKNLNNKHNRLLEIAKEGLNKG